MASSPKSHLTFEQYLDVERAAEFRSEYYYGEMHAMSGGTGDHSSVSVNCVTALAAALVSKGCRVFDANMRVYTPQAGYCFYPDASATCERPIYFNESNDVLLNPVLIVEVLSRSTQNFDRGDKFRAYRSIPTLRDYLLVSPREVLVEHWSAASGNWSWVHEYKDQSDQLTIASFGLTLSVKSFYLGIDMG